MQTSEHIPLVLSQGASWLEASATSDTTLTGRARAEALFGTLPSGRLEAEAANWIVGWSCGARMTFSGCPDGRIAASVMAAFLGKLSPSVCSGNLGSMSCALRSAPTWTHLLLGMRSLVETHSPYARSVLRMMLRLGSKLCRILVPPSARDALSNATVGLMVGQEAIVGVDRRANTWWRSSDVDLLPPETHDLLEVIGTFAARFGGPLFGVSDAAEVAEATAILAFLITFNNAIWYPTSIKFAQATTATAPQAPGM
jgi:hypothetical protein